MGIIGYSSYCNLSKTLDYEKLVVLGPKRTSSYYCATEFMKNNLINFKQIVLKNNFDDVYEYLSINKNSIALIPNAWKGINEFYIDNQLEIFASFLLDTKPYSIAGYKKSLNEYNKKIKIATHPAPLQMIKNYIPHNIEYEIIIVESTEKAAKLVKTKEVDICLSNELAIKHYELNILSEPFTITMLWSLFKHKEYKENKK